MTAEHAFDTPGYAATSYALAAASECSGPPEESCPDAGCPAHGDHGDHDERDDAEEEGQP